MPLSESGAAAALARPLFLALVARFCEQLRRAGLALSVDQAQTFVGAFEWLPADRQHLYQAGLCCLVSRAEEKPAYDAVFLRFWEGRSEAPQGQPAPVAPRHIPRRKPALARLLAQRSEPGDPEVDVEDRSLTASPEQVLGRKDFAQLTHAELEALRRLLAQEPWAFVRRLSRRRVASHRGPVDLRRSSRFWSRLGGQAACLVRSRRKEKPRKLVILADVSGSMELYARVLLMFTHALARRFDGVESFAFATRLSRATPQLNARNPDQALSELCRELTDFGSGTRIGECLRAFNRRYASVALGRGAVVLILSDGCECGDPALLGRELSRVQRRAHRVVWLNPRLGDARYEPTVEGMAVALHNVDDFLPCNNLHSLQALGRRLSELPARRRRPSGNSRRYGRTDGSKPEI